MLQGELRVYNLVRRTGQYYQLTVTFFHLKKQL